MKPQICVYAARIARFSSLPAGSSQSSGSNGGWSRAFQRLVALAMALVLLPLAQVEVAAQQAPQYAQYPQNQYQQSQYPPNGPYSGQYAPGPQPGYSQPGYAQPQPYAQQPYGQPSPGQRYAQQPYADQPYADNDPGYQQPGYGEAQPAAQAFTAEQLEEMLAPIALYPDALLAQVLAASTYPAQVASADQWLAELRGQGYASADQIAAGADAQSWDPSVKALTAFPQVLAQMNHDLAWTTDLGNAYFNQPQDVLQTVQVLRQRAQAAGTLQSTPQEQITYDQGNMELAPADPQTAYLPMYNPWNVYGDPVTPYPGFSLLGTLDSVFGSSAIQYGLGIAMAAFTHTPFGWMSWALDWLGNSILFNHSNYYSQSTSVAHWGSSRGGGTWARGSRQGEGYGRGQYGQTRGGYGRQGNEYSGYNGRGGQGFARQPDRNPGNGYGRDGYAGSRAYMGSGARDGENRGYQARNGYGSGYGNGYVNSVRPAFQNYAYNRQPEGPQQSYAARGYQAPSYARGYGSSFYGGTGQAHGGRPGGVYGSQQQGRRAPSAAPRNDFGTRNFAAQRSAPMSRGFAGYSAKPQHSGGFHLFGGGGHSYGGGKAPKSFGGGRHSGGGGHSSSKGWGHRR